MLGEIIGYILISFFSIYGLVQFIFYVADFIYDIKTLRDKVVYTVVGIKNEEERVEGIARALLWKALRNDTGVADRKIVLFDFNANEETKEIIEHLSATNAGVQIMEKDDFIKDLENSI